MHFCFAALHRKRIGELMTSSNHVKVHLFVTDSVLATVPDYVLTYLMKGSKFVADLDSLGFRELAHGLSSLDRKLRNLKKNR